MAPALVQRPSGDSPGGRHAPDEDLRRPRVAGEDDVLPLRHHRRAEGHRALRQRRRGTPDDHRGRVQEALDQKRLPARR